MGCQPPPAVGVGGRLVGDYTRGGLSEHVVLKRAWTVGTEGDERTLMLQHGLCADLDNVGLQTGLVTDGGVAARWSSVCVGTSKRATHGVVT